MLPCSVGLTGHNPERGTAMEAFVQVSSFNLQNKLIFLFLVLKENKKKVKAKLS